jgi:hypothetical protein
MTPRKTAPKTEPKKGQPAAEAKKAPAVAATAPEPEPKSRPTVLEPITARISDEAARRLRVAAALENLSTGQLLDRMILEHLADLPTMVGLAWDYTRRRPFGQ